VIELSGHGPETRLDVSERFSEGQLREGHDEELVPASEPPGSPIAIVSRDAFCKFVPWQEFHELRKNQLSGMHKSALSAVWRPEHDRKAA